MGVTPTSCRHGCTHLFEHRLLPLADLLAKFRVAREANVRRLESYDDTFIQRTSLHPRLEQPMRVMDLMFFVAEHDDHHLATISQLLQTAR